MNYVVINALYLLMCIVFANISWAVINWDARKFSGSKCLCFCGFSNQTCLDLNIRPHLCLSKFTADSVESAFCFFSFFPSLLSLESLRKKSVSHDLGGGGFDLIHVPLED